MNWDEIEAKWAAMARRVRSDLPANAKPEDGPSLPLPVTPAVVKAAAQRPVVTVK